MTKAGIMMARILEKDFEEYVLTSLYNAHLGEDTYNLITSKKNTPSRCKVEFQS